MPGYGISTSASSAGESSQLNNRTSNIIERPLIDYENNQVEKNIVAAKGDELVSLSMNYSL